MSRSFPFVDLAINGEVIISIFFYYSFNEEEYLWTTNIEHIYIIIIIKKNENCSVFSTSTKMVFYVQGAWHYPYTAPSIVQGKLFVLWLGNIPTESASPILRQGACMVTLRIDFPVGRKLCLLIDIHVASIRIHQFKEENHFNFSRPISFCLMCAFEYVNYTFNYWFNDIYVLKFSQI